MLHPLQMTAIFEPFPAVTHGVYTSATEYWQTITRWPSLSAYSTEELRVWSYMEPDFIKPADPPGLFTPSESRDSLPLIGDILTSRLFKVTVGQGGNAKTYSVHANALRQSSTFATAIDGRWKASRTGELDLAEDEPRVFDRLVEYLYCGDFSPKTTNRFGKETFTLLHLQAEIEAKILVELYCMADKYCVAGIEEKVIQKLKCCNLTVEDFLDLMQFAYNNLPDQDQPCHFKSWTKDYIRLNHMLFTNKLYTNKSLQPVIECGGRLAWDLHIGLLQAKF